MSIRDRDIDEWFRRWSPWWGAGRRGGGESLFREFEEMRRDMERMIEESFRDLDRIPKELIREYETPSGGKVREVGPLVYGYSMTIGPDGKPKIKQFGNVRSLGGGMTPPSLTAEREPLADVITTDKDVKVTVEMSGISKQDMKISAYEDSVEVSTLETAPKKYRRLIELPPETDIESAKSTYANGRLEIMFRKKGKPKGREIKID